jgi:putative hydrolase of the HAD superfamily
MDVVREAGGALAGAPLRAGIAPAAWQIERERVRAFERDWYGAALARIGARPECRAVHAALRARGVRQVVLSDYDSDYKLRALGFEGGFDAIFSGESMGWLKPSEQLYRRVAHALGVRPERWLHIGDRVDRDERPARTVGCQTLLVGRDRLRERILGT